MKKLFLFLISIIYLSCNDSKKTHSPKAEAAQVEENTLEYGAGEEDLLVDTMPEEVYGDDFEGDESDYDVLGFFVTAQGGLLCRDAPGGEVIYKFSYGEEVHIKEVTDEQLTIIDEGEEISGNWVEVYIPDSALTGYVFDGFLASMTLDLDPIKIATLTPAFFIDVSDEEGLLLDGEHYTYDENLNMIGEIEVSKISDIEIIDATRFERPERKDVAIANYWEEHCEWANFVTIKYNGKEIIVFGEYVLQITSNEELTYKSKKIDLIHAKSFLTKTGTLIHELSGCSAGYDFLIKSDNEYSFVKDAESEVEDPDKVYTLFFDENEYGSASIYDETVKNDTIFAKVSQHFQEGVGAYKLKIFKDGGWHYIEYDTTRDYEQGN